LQDQSRRAIIKVSAREGHGSRKMRARPKEPSSLTELASVLLAGAIAVLVLAVPSPQRPYRVHRVSNMTEPHVEEASEPAPTSGPPQRGNARAATEEAKTPDWHRPRFEERKQERERMVQEHITGPGRGVKDPAVLAAMREVPRHLFVPRAYSQAAYADRPLPIGYGQTISQPYIVAFMTEALGIQPGERVLEIGTGSGYQAAVLSELTPHVYSIEIVRELAERAKERLQKLGYSTAEVKTGDGYFGWQECAPFDAIIVTCAAGHVPPPLIEQLSPAGRIIIPVGAPYETQYLVLVTRQTDGQLRSTQLLPVLFVPMTGRIQGGK